MKSSMSRIPTQNLESMWESGAYDFCGVGSYGIILYVSFQNTQYTEKGFTKPTEGRCGRL